MGWRVGWEAVALLVALAQAEVVGLRQMTIVEVDVEAAEAQRQAANQPAAERHQGEAALPWMHVEAVEEEAGAGHFAK